MLNNLKRKRKQHEDIRIHNNWNCVIYLPEIYIHLKCYLKTIYLHQRK